MAARRGRTEDDQREGEVTRRVSVGNKTLWRFARLLPTRLSFMIQRIHWHQAIAEPRDDHAPLALCEHEHERPRRLPGRERDVRRWQRDARRRQQRGCQGQKLFELRARDSYFF